MLEARSVLEAALGPQHERTARAVESLEALYDARGAADSARAGNP
jgi:hypothetical protein